MKVQDAMLNENQDSCVEICEGCCEHVRQVGEDGISVCENCGVVEGYTKWITESEYAVLNE